MRNNSKGGMRTSGTGYSIYCPRCGKPAARAEETEKGKKYLHFTKSGSVWHTTENCVICGSEIKGHGNNAAPVKEGMCCDVCNYAVVVPARRKTADG